jgi:hypothetical protein
VTPTRISPTSRPQPAGDTLYLNVFIDALGWPVAEGNAFLPELGAVRQPVRTVLGYSSGAVPTILTGLLPRQHGQWSFFYYAPRTSPFGFLRPLALLPHVLAANHRVRVPLSRQVKRLLGYTGYFSLYAFPFARLGDFDYCEKRDLFAPGGMPGVPTVFDALRPAGIAFHLSDWRASEDANLAAARAAVADPALRTTFVYLPALDGAMHLGGHAAAPTRLERYAREIRTLQAEARRHHRRVVTRLFSDHGMAHVRRTADLKRVVEGDGLAYGRDFAVTYDSTMARFWWLREGVAEAMRERLEKLGVGRFLTREERHDLGIDFPGDRYGEDFFLCDPGVLVVPSDLGLKPIAGMHGYHPDDVDSDGVLLSDEALPVRVQRIDDLNTLMRADVGLPAAAGAPGAAARQWTQRTGEGARA